jgi:hypothetical protein
MITRKELVARCEKLASEIKDLDDKYYFEEGYAAALDLTWPMIEELKEENKLLKKQLEIPRVPTIENFLRIQKERDNLQAKLKVYEEALINHYCVIRQQDNGRCYVCDLINNRLDLEQAKEMKQ